jgi:lipid-A-disaccharide synthase-like uncharacterized protein
MQKRFQRSALCNADAGPVRVYAADPFLVLPRMPPQRRSADRTSVKLIGWIACLALAGSLTYTFVRSLIEGPAGIDPLFFALQTLASFLFLVYSMKLRNTVFVVANVVALVNVVGTLVVVAVN